MPASETKLSRLQTMVPEGMVVDAAWLERHGYSHALRQRYVASGWLEMVARGLYLRPFATLGDECPQTLPLSWELLVLSMQHLLGLDVSVGGRTALDLHGYTHFVLSQTQTPVVHLYCAKPLPAWVEQIQVDAKWVVHARDRLFENPGRGLDAVELPDAPVEDDSNSSYGFGHRQWPMTISTPERATLEVLDEVPKRETFEQADALFDGLTTLMPRRLQRLLEACRSVKVKRLFLLFAERHKHAWLRHLDLKRIDLGKGKRSLSPGGKLDPKFQVVVPDFMLSTSDGL
jgi:hypothetical protein